MNPLRDIASFVSDRFLFGDDAPAAHVPLFESGIMDSTGVLEVVLFIQQRYGLAVPDEDLVPEHFSTLGRIATYINDRLADIPA